MSVAATSLRKTIRPEVSVASTASPILCNVVSSHSFCSSARRPPRPADLRISRASSPPKTSKAAAAIEVAITNAEVAERVLAFISEIRLACKRTSTASISAIEVRMSSMMFFPTFDWTRVFACFGLTGTRHRNGVG